MPQIQNAAFHAISHVIDMLDEVTIRKTIFPKTKQIFESNSSVPVQSNTLLCIERIIDNLDKSDILDHVLPIMLQAKLGEPLVLMPILRIYKKMIQDKRFGLTISILASKVMPSLTPVIISPNLRMEEVLLLTFKNNFGQLPILLQFTCLVDLLQELLEHVSRNQRNKLKLERLSMGSIDTTGYVRS